jgi:hypothetical protein
LAGFDMSKKTSFKIWILAIAVILIGGGILFWQYFLTVEEVEAPGAEISEIPREKEEFKRLTLESLENAEYYFALYKKKAYLAGGIHEEEEMVDEGGFSYIFSAGMIEDVMAFGDLDNDGKEDAVVIIYSTGGGSGLFYELAVMMNKDGIPHHLTSEYLGDRVKVNSIAIRDGIITLDMIIHDVGDAACCPTLYKIFQYKLSEEELLKI